ncbi:RdgB/HAM1 family non-canonical purine NTP pyrophosphatase [Rubrobacter indicoceani]|uniref:RdgB/HAM1 family non-canonical purine NTP pyrophosphatase n=1 Tax=Rubrobacter indicoceani TaxID=2051957 RepID=UPI000E5BFC86|nr:RdgB/HAM1 family non-canonical purine NTP pyrophosphatase [Rubrobacter indicoceani]
MMPEKPIFVTSNKNKLREAEAILGVKLDRAAPNVPELQSLDFAEVASAKARAARAALGDPNAPVIVDDSGLVVNAWNDFPGALTKWFLRSVGVSGLLKMLSAFPDRSARSVCVVAVSASSGEIHLFRGEVEGEIADAPRGAAGFGYDPVFVPNGHRRTYSEMGDEKHENSHRNRAFNALAVWLTAGRKG